MTMLAERLLWQPNDVTVTLPETIKKDGKPKAAGLVILAEDTGRILMLQRYLDDDDPAGGSWEFPGGRLDDGESPEEAARREWAEETGCDVPAGKIIGSWVTPDGVYHGYVLEIPHEADVQIHHGRKPGANPDDPDDDEVESLAWWTPKDAKHNPALRGELAEDWKLVKRALKGKTDKGTSAYAQMLKDYPADSISWMHGLHWERTEIPQSLVDDDSVKRWQASHEAGKVDHFKRRIRAGADPHPVVAVKPPGSHRYVVIDGHHRTLAYRELGEPVPAYVAQVPSRQGPWLETHSSQYRNDGAHPTRAEKSFLGKVGPKGYIHGWIKVGPGVGIADVAVSSKTGEVKHRETRHTLGKVTRGEDGKWVAHHESGRQSTGYSSRHKATVAVVEHHNAAHKAQQQVTKPEKPVTPSAPVSTPAGPKTHPAKIPGGKPVQSLNPGDHPGHLTQDAAYAHPKTVTTLPTGAKSALNSYAGNGYAPMNGYLRDGTYAGIPVTGSYKDKLERQIKAIDAAFAAAKPTTQPMVVHRGFRNADKILGSEPRVGHIFTEKGFTSTSASHYFSGDAQVDVRIPAGAHVLRPYDYHQKHAHENEILLPRGSSFKVISDSGPGKKPRKVTLEYVVPTGKPSMDTKKTASELGLRVTKKDDADHLAFQQWMADEDPAVRAVNLWSNNRLQMENVRSQFRGEKWTPQFSPKMDYTYEPGKGTVARDIYNLDDYRKDIENAANWVWQTLDNAQPMKDPLYRGMVFDSSKPEDVAALKGLTTPGNEFSTDLASWITTTKGADGYASQWGSMFGMAKPEKVRLELAPGAHAANIDRPEIYGMTKGTGEHLAAGQYRIESVSKDGDMTVVKVKEIGRGGHHEVDSAVHGSATAASGKAGGKETKPVTSTPELGPRGLPVTTMSHDEAKMINRYTNTSYARINMDLRAGRPVNQDYQAVDKALEDVMARTPASTQSHELLRGLKWDDALDEQMRPGHVFTDKGWVSTTANPEVAKDFYTSHGQHVDNGAVMHITAPPGTKGIDIDHVMTQMEKPRKPTEEDEVILPKGSKFRVDRVETDKQGLMHVYVTHLPK